MAILKVKDKNGNIISIPAVKGDDGTTYVFTEVEQKEMIDKTLNSMPQAEEMLL